jgi:translation initiation factor 1
VGKKRDDRSKTGDAGFGSAFAGLAGLRDALPEGEAPADPPPEPAPEGRGKVVVRRERSGRGGKTVTVIEGVGQGREDVAKRMKKALGVGARVEGEDVVLQGALEDRAAKWLEDNGFPRVVRGTS